MNVREATLDDVPDVISLGLAFATETGERVDPKKFTNTLLWCLTMKHYKAILCFDGDLLVGGGLFFFSDSTIDDSRTLMKQWVYVRPGPKRGLILRSLLGAAETFGQENQCREFLFFLDNRYGQSERTDEAMKLFGFASTGVMYTKKL